MPISTNKPFSQEEEPNGEDSTPRSRFGSAFLEMLRKNQDASAFQVQQRPERRHRHTEGNFEFAQETDPGAKSCLGRHMSGMRRASLLERHAASKNASRRQSVSIMEQWDVKSHAGSVSSGWSMRDSEEDVDHLPQPPRKGGHINSGAPETQGHQQRHPPSAQLAGGAGLKREDGGSRLRQGHRPVARSWSFSGAGSCGRLSEVGENPSASVQDRISCVHSQGSQDIEQQQQQQQQGGRGPHREGAGLSPSSPGVNPSPAPSPTAGGAGADCESAHELELATQGSTRHYMGSRLVGGLALARRRSITFSNEPPRAADAPALAQRGGPVSLSDKPGNGAAGGPQHRSLASRPSSLLDVGLKSKSSGSLEGLLASSGLRGSLQAGTVQQLRTCSSLVQPLPSGNEGGGGPSRGIKHERVSLPSLASSTGSHAPSSLRPKGLRLVPQQSVTFSGLRGPLSSSPPAHQLLLERRASLVRHEPLAARSADVAFAGTELDHSASHSSCEDRSLLSAKSLSPCPSTPGATGSLSPLGLRRHSTTSPFVDVQLTSLAPQPPVAPLGSRRRPSALLPSGRRLASFGGADKGPDNLDPPVLARGATLHGRPSHDAHAHGSP